MTAHRSMHDGTASPTAAAPIAAAADVDEAMLRRQRRRSIWLGVGLAGLAVAFYLSIIVKIGTVGL